MLNRKLLLPIMFILFVVLGLVMPVAAQDFVTNTPAATVEATINGTPVEATLVAPVETPAPQPSIFSPALFGQLLLFLGLSAFAGGGVVAILLNFLGRKEVRDRVEDARNSWSPEQQEFLADFTGLFERVTNGVLDFLKAVQDGKPNDVPIAQFAAVQGPALATKGEIEFLSEQLALHQKHYPVPTNVNVNVRNPDDAQAAVDGFTQALNQVPRDIT